MGEDRAPHLGGRDIPEESAPSALPRKTLELRAKAARSREAREAKVGGDSERQSGRPTAQDADRQEAPLRPDDSTSADGHP